LCCPEVTLVLMWSDGATLLIVFILSSRPVRGDSSSNLDN